MIITYHSNGQLNIDSLFGSMKSYNLIKKSENSGFTELIFNKENEKLTYQFTTDNNGKIADNVWGNCLLILKKDSIGRLIEQHTYNKKGNLFGADSPPVIKIKYRDDVHIKQTDYYNSNLSFVERIEVYYDSIGREIALIGYDKNLKMTTKQTTDYLDKIFVFVCQ